MNSRRVQTVMLCEDIQQEVFLYRLLKHMGRGDQRTITVKRSAKGKGSAEQYVREQFPKEVQAFRSKSSYLNLCLIVMVDADIVSIGERIGQLEESLEEAGQDRRTAEERILILVPKRNIETWIRYLDGEIWDETTEYAKLCNERDCMPAVEKLIALYPKGIPNRAPESLRLAYAEAGRCRTYDRAH